MRPSSGVRPVRLMWSDITISVPGPEGRVQPAGGVGQDDDPGAQGVEEQDGLDDEARVVALVQVEPTLEHDDGPAAEATQRAAGPTWPGAVAAGQPGRSVERDGDGVLEVVGQAAEAGAEDDPDLRDQVASARGPRPRARRSGPAARSAGWVGSGRWATVGSAAADMRASRIASRGRRPRPAASSARRKYRHRDADRVPSGAGHAGGPW